MNRSHIDKNKGAIRHKDVRLCAFGVDGEAFPDFESNSSWYNIKVLKSLGRNRTQSLNYEAENQSIRRAFDTVGVISLHTTHASRGSGARIAELNDANTDEVARMGGWNTGGSLKSSYLTHLPRDAIRVFNGHPRGFGNFWLPRAGVEPAEELQRMIFPEVEGWLARLSDKNDCAYNSSQTAFSFLKLLQKIRKFILQDAVMMMLEDHDNIIFSHAVFKN